MLRGKEIQAIAARQKVRDTQIEKDYVITWLLWGISKRPLLLESLVFKGGTVLKKAWFPDYRFSEDLDFTLIDAEMSDETLLAEFQAAATSIETGSAIQLELGQLEKHQSGSIAFYVHFVGSLGGKMGSNIWLIKSLNCRSLMGFGGRWGGISGSLSSIHHDAEGKVAVYPLGSEEYARFLQDESLKKIKAMRSKRG
ncbi:MAG: nucleotidyl transferase AbiEii/AbiGii toxin family protein [Saprospiraceae bacterium]